MRYQWIAANHHPHGDATKVVEYLESLRAKDDLTLDRIVEDAERADSPLHQRFDWQDTSAARRYRRAQAATMLSHLVRVAEDGTVGRVYIGVAGDRPGTRHYDLVTRVMRNPARRRPYARRALLELANWKLRYQDVPELRKALEQVEQTLKRVVRPALAALTEEG